MTTNKRYVQLLAMVQIRKKARLNALNFLIYIKTIKNIQIIANEKVS